MGWHSDDEPEIGPRPTIASLSLGAERDFKLKRPAGEEVFTVPLQHGDLVVMRDESSRTIATRFRAALG